MAKSSPEMTLIHEFEEVMRGEGVAETAIASFRYHFKRLVDGDRGLLPEESIRPITQLPDADGFADYEVAGRATLPRVVVVKLNGGLGTSMGLDRAKSLLLVRDDQSFLDLIAHQVLALRTEIGEAIPLVLMNSFRTVEDSERALAAYPDLEIGDLPLGFVQNMVPKVMADDLAPAISESRPELGWCPPGHGDFYTAIKGSGLLDRLLDRGVEYAFVSNADNLGAALDTSLLGYMVTEGIGFMLEAADRTPADRKGGHVCHLADGRLALRESVQCPADDEDSFQDTDRHRYFNSNNLWLHLPTLGRLLDENDGFLPLPTVVNRKNLDPRDPGSPEVFQLETVMGTAISLFPRAAAVRVSRRRFSPVKNTNDLLGVRSDAYDLADDGRIVLSPERTSPPVVRLDEKFFKFIDDFEKRFPDGVPSLLRCDRLAINGNVTFGANVVIEGDASIKANRPSSIPDGSKIRGNIDL